MEAKLKTNAAILALITAAATNSLVSMTRESGLRATCGPELFQNILWAALPTAFGSSLHLLETQRQVWLCWMPFQAVEAQLLCLSNTVEVALPLSRFKSQANCLKTTWRFMDAKNVKWYRSLFWNLMRCLTIKSMPSFWVLSKLIFKYSAWNLRMRSIKHWIIHQTWFYFSPKQQNCHNSYRFWIKGNLAFLALREETSCLSWVWKRANSA